MNIPQSWRDLLAAIQAVCPTAVIAGGALRDLDNFRPIKDVDIFINARGMVEAQDACAALKAAGYPVEPTFDEKTVYPEDENLEVVLVTDLGVTVCATDDAYLVQVPVQLIFVNWDTARITDRFDYGICRLSFDGGAVIPPMEYIDDKANKVFKLRRSRPTPLSMRGSIHRYARLTAEKYQGWTWWPFEEPCDFLLP